MTPAFNTMFLPEAYGGQGFGAFDMVLVNEEFAKVDGVHLQRHHRRVRHPSP